MSEDAETLVEQRIAQLEKISERRNALLREMYHMLRRRNKAGPVLTLDDDGNEEDLHIFVNKFKLDPSDPNSGCFAQLPHSELFGLLPPRSPSPIAPLQSTSVSKGASRTKSPLSDQSTSISRPESVPSPQKSQPVAAKQADEDSDDELDLIGTPSTNFRSPTVSHSNVIEISNAADEAQVIPVGGDLAEEQDEDEDFVKEETPVPTAQIITQDQDDQSWVEHDPDPGVVISEATEGTPVPQEVVQPLPVTKVDEIRGMDVDEREHAHQDPTTTQQDVSPFVETSGTQDNGAMVVDEDHVSSKHSPDGSPRREPSPLPQAQEAPPAEAKINTISPQQLEIVPRESLFIHPPSTPVFIPIPTTTYHHGINIQFPPDSGLGSQQDAPSAHSRYNTESEYPLPPIKSLPLEFNINKKGKHAKQKKKERERAEKAGIKAEGKDEWTPMGFNRWVVTIRTNPLYKRVSKATKCLTTHDWTVAMNELKIVRTSDRIETLKAKGRWSFRQPKKQRGVGGATKTHWDYLLEEMKWMRTDFREERKWKLAVAYNLSTAVLEWHEAGSLEERIKRGICVLWKPPQDDQDADMSLDPTDEDNTGSQPSPEKSMVDYGSDDDEEEEQEKEQSVLDPALDNTALLQEFVAEENREEENIGMKDLEPKKEDIDDPHALEDTSMAVDPESSQGSNVAQKEEPDASVPAGLKSVSDDPILGSKSNTHSSEPSNPHSKTYKRSAYAPIRESIAFSDLDKLFVDLDDFHISTDNGEDSASRSIHPPSDLSDIFPDLQPYGILDVAPSNPPEGKKKSDKKSDQDPNKRVEETAYNKIHPTSRFITSKPTLVSALEPSKHFKDGQWGSFDEVPVTVEYDAAPARVVSEEFANKLFDYKPTPLQIVTPAIPNAPAQSNQTPTQKRSIEHLWTANDDNLLKSLVDKYPNNWDLIAECFNATKQAVITDMRTSRDCQERWRDLWGQNQDRQRALDPSGNEGTPPPSASTSMTTRGVKRVASNSVSGTASGSSIGSEPKKRRRHMFMQDTIRKSAKKRVEAAQKAAVRKPAVLHETHNQYSRMPKMSPAELGRMRLEAELRASQERQMSMNRQQQRPSVPQAAGQPVPANGAPANGVARPAAPAVQNPNAVPPIRSQVQVNISQQQRAATPLIAGQSRLSPQQQLLQAQQQLRAQQQSGNAAQQQHAISQQALAAALQHLPAANGGAATLQNSTHPAINGNTAAIPNPHMSPPYNAASSRDSTSSPAHTSPPRTSATPSNAVSSPRPPSAQAQAQPVPQPQAQLQNGQIGAMNIPRATNVHGSYYIPNHPHPNHPPPTQEQLHAMMMQLYQYQQQQPQQAQTPQQHQIQVQQQAQQPQQQMNQQNGGGGFQQPQS